MCTFERSTDWPLIKSIVTHPKIWPYVSDDFSPAPEEYKPLDLDIVQNVVARDADGVVGVWILIPHTNVVWSVHTCLLPSAWGNRAKRAVKEAIQWVWDTTDCLRLITEVPADNRIAFSFARKAGMTEYGVNPKSHMKNGKLQDMILLGISKPGV